MPNSSYLHNFLQNAQVMSLYGTYNALQFKKCIVLYLGLHLFLVL